MKKRVAIGLLGPVLDSGFAQDRWNRWRPTVALCQHEDLTIDRFEILYQARFEKLAQLIVKDLGSVSPETEVRLHKTNQKNPWDFEEVYGSLHDFVKSYSFDTEKEEYLVHITTGTHVAQICLFLLTEAHYLPGRLIQTAPPRRQEKGTGAYAIVDLDLSKYDKIASRFHKEHKEGISFLKSGIETKNSQFNRLIEKIEQVAIASKSPILLMGPTGAGKSQLARRIFELKKARRQIEGGFVEVNCATVRGDAAMSALFGHTKGAFTGAMQDRTGLLRKADQGILFLDEIGELGLDEQAMLLRALEEKVFFPLGSDKEQRSDFQLIAGTNKNLAEKVSRGEFRDDLLARINLWTFSLPALKERREDIEPNLQYELEQFARLNNSKIAFNKESREKFLNFATSVEAEWKGNFRDLNAAVNRMCTLSQEGRISVETVEEEMQRLQQAWKTADSFHEESDLSAFLTPEKIASLDYFDQTQLAQVIAVCKASKNMSEAGRKLFANSRVLKKSSNDADRLRKYLAKFGLSWADLDEQE